jgi:pimeloyl-ACP methyl ester carboxylesterase
LAEIEKLESRTLFSHSGDSPYDPPSDESHVVVDTGSGLDTGCTFASGGPLTIDLPISRCIDPTKLAAHMSLPSTLTLTLPAYDVDYDGDPDNPSTPPERDEVYFVGKNGVRDDLGTLEGANNIWQNNTFQIPIADVDFGSEDSSGDVTPGVNQIVVNIDTASPPGADTWCTAIDWVALQVPVVHPVLLVHGILSGPATWAADGSGFDWEDALTSWGVPWEAIDLSGYNKALGSIGSDAAQIASTVQTMTQTFGVQKVNIVAHSKGGLDSRQFAETSDSLDTLIQLDTPNAGSPLATKVLSTLARISLPGTVVASLLAPAGVELTPQYMAIYNLFHKLNPDVKYYAVAGDYTFTGFGSTLLNNFFDSFYGGPNSLVVANSSVYAIPGITELPAWSSSGSDHSAIHTGVTHSEGIFDEVAPYLLSSAGGTPNALTATAATTPAAVPIALAPSGGTIAAGQTQTQQFTVDASASGPSAFTLDYASGVLGFTLTSPSGTTIDPTYVTANSAAAGYAEEDDDAQTGGKEDTYVLANAEPGVWTANITGSSVTDQSGYEAYVVSAVEQSSGILMPVSSDAGAYTVGQTVTLTANPTLNGTPITGATVDATVVLPDQTTQDVPLIDNGAGVYSGAFAPTQTGVYAMTVTGEAGGSSAFSRFGAVVAAVSSGTATLTGSYDTTVNDTNGDGLYDTLTASIGVSVGSGGNYRLSACLTDSGGAVIDTAVKDVTLAAGTSSVDLDFDGSKIYNYGVDGPYDVTMVTLAEDNDGLLTTAATAPNAATTTSAYQYTDFQHAAVTAETGGTSKTADTDDNGQFDTLTVSLPVSVSTAGDYQWSGELLDSVGRVAARISNSGTLSVGDNTLDFPFDGREIWSNGYDGPYHVGNIAIVGPSSEAIDSTSFTTPAYTAIQFEHGADLVVTNVTFDGPLLAGQSQSITYTVKNVGETATETGTWQDGIYLSATGTFDSTDELLTDESHSGVLQPGDSYTATARFTTPSSATSADAVVIFTDSANQIREGAGEADNFASTLVPFTLTVGSSATTVVNGQTSPIAVAATDVVTQGAATDFTITDTGNQPLTLGPVQLTAGFHVTEAPAASVAGGQSVTFSVAASASAPVGILTGQLTIPVGSESVSFPLSSRVWQAVPIPVKKKVFYIDAAARKVAVLLSGPGSAELRFAAPFASPTGKSLIYAADENPSEMILNGATGATSISVTVAGGARTPIELITINGSARLVNAPSADLTNLTAAGSIGSLTIGSAAAGGNWYVAGAIGKIHAGSFAAGSLIDVVGAVASIITKGDFNGSLAAATIGTFTIGGSATGATVYAGTDFGSDAALGGTGTASDDFNAGTISSVKVHGAVDGSVFAAGLDPVDGIYFDGDDQLIPNGLIKSFAAASLSDDSHVLAAALPQKVKLGHVTVVPAADARFSSSS